jgi:hypothetical protein
MQGTQKLHPVSAAEPAGARHATPIAIACALVLVGLSYLLFMTQPTMLGALNAAFAHVAPQGRAPAWLLPGLAAVIAMLGVALGSVLLSAFIHGVQSAPYAWLAPLLVGFSSVVLGRMQLQLPLDRLSPAAFAALSGLLLLGGGALVQSRSVPTRLSGGLALLLPLITLSVAYGRARGSMENAARTLDMSSGMFLFVLALTSLGVALVALTARPTRSARDAAARAKTWQQHREQLAEALDRLRESELRAAEAERRAQAAEYGMQSHGMAFAAPGFGSHRADDTEDFVALARPPMLTMGSAWMAGIAILLCGGMAAAYVGAYRPLARRAAAQAALANESAKEHAQEIDALRKHFEEERQALITSAAAERKKSDDALAAIEEAHKQGPAVKAVVETRPAAHAAVVEAPKPVAAAVQLEATPATATHRAPAKHAATHPAKRVKASVAQGARTASGKRAGSDAAARSAPEKSDVPVLHEKVNDDPIGGLEGM